MQYCNILIHTFTHFVMRSSSQLKSDSLAIFSCHQSSDPFGFPPLGYFLFFDTSIFLSTLQIVLYPSDCLRVSSLQLRLETQGLNCCVGLSIEKVKVLLKCCWPFVLVAALDDDHRSSGGRKVSSGLHRIAKSAGRPRPWRRLSSDRCEAKLIAAMVDSIYFHSHKNSHGSDHLQMMKTATPLYPLL